MVANFDRETVRRKAGKRLDDIDGLWQPQTARDLVLELKELCGLGGRGGPEPPSEEALVRLGGVVREFAHRMWELGSFHVVDGIGAELGDQLALGIRRLDPDEDAELRATLLRDLWELVRTDLRQGRNVYADMFAGLFGAATTESEKSALEDWFRTLLDDLPDDADVDSPRGVAGHWMVEYLGDDLDDENFEQICRETGQFVRLVDRALNVGRTDEALKWAQETSHQRVADLCWAFHDRDQLDTLVEADALPDPEYKPIPIDEVYDTALMLLDADQTDEALPWIRLAVRERILDETIDGLRKAAEEADVWDREVREAVLGDVSENWPDAALDHHLRFGDLSAAFDLWESTDLDRREWRRFGNRLLDQAVEMGSTDIGLGVALALADSRIEQRGRNNYRKAAEHLSTARQLVEDSNHPPDWPTIIEEYDDRLDRLPAFRDEAEGADLLG